MDARHPLLETTLRFVLVRRDLPRFPHVKVKNGLFDWATAIEVSISASAFRLILLPWLTRYARESMTFVIFFSAIFDIPSLSTIGMMPEAVTDPCRWREDVDRKGLTPCNRFRKEVPMRSDGVANPDRYFALRILKEVPNCCPPTRCNPKLGVVFCCNNADSHSHVAHSSSVRSSKPSTM